MPSAITTIADLFVPEIWTQGARERMATMPSLLSTNSVVNSPELDTFAAGPGTSVTISGFRDLTNTADAIQVENEEIVTHKVTDFQQIAPLLNRQTAFDSTALSRTVPVTGDPVQAVVDQIASMRAKQRQETLVNILRGVFGTAISVNSMDTFHEAIADQNPATDLLTGDHVLDAAGLLGELMGGLDGCVFFAHPRIITNLRKQNEIDFIPASANGTLFLDTYKSCPVVYSSSLVRAGTTDGLVYDSYLLAPSSIGWGEKPQSNRVGDVAHLILDGDARKNNLALIDRTRFLMHIAGTRWVGTPAGQSATNAELATAGNWELAYQTANRVPIVRIRTNG